MQEGRWPTTSPRCIAVIAAEKNVVTRASMMTVETSRLILRPLTRADAGAVARHLGNWNVTRMLALPPWPYRLADAEYYVARMASRLADDPSITLAMTLKDHEPMGQPIGIVDIGIQGRLPVLGYWLAEPHWGQGLMTEAVCATVRYAFATRPIETIYSGVFYDNPASLAVQKKLGFTVVGESAVRCMPRNLVVRHIDTELTPAAFATASAESPMR